MSPNNMNLCRQHLDATIDKVQPKLIFACGNLGYEDAYQEERHHQQERKVV